jgi:hypothetical protein
VSRWIKVQLLSRGCLAHPLTRVVPTSCDKLKFVVRHQPLRGKTGKAVQKPPLPAQL